MRLVKVGTASVSVKVGDYKRNVKYIKEVIREAERQGVNLLVLPELVISGYSLEDRVYWDEVVNASWEYLNKVAETTRSGIGVFIGLPVKKDVHLYNASAFVCGGKIWGLIMKQYIPGYHVFYESRYWSSWDGSTTEINGIPAGDLIFELPYGKVSAEICEDIWVPTSPSIERVLSGAEIICNLSASPFAPLKNLTRRRVIISSAVKLKCIYVYSNLLGYDGSRLVFDGGGIIATPEGRFVESPLLSYTPWTLTTMIVDLDEVTRTREENSSWKLNSIDVLKESKVNIIEVNSHTNRLPKIKEWVTQLPKSFYIPETEFSGYPSERKISENYFEQLFNALVLGLRDYFEKVGVFDKFLVALSGGRDSALCLLLAVEASKQIEGGKYKNKYKEKVEAIYLPNKYFSSSETLDCAKSLAEELGVPFKVVSISEEAELALKKSAEIMGDENKVKPITRQNLQARIRGAMMLNWANNVNGLLLVTSNLSESAVGYTTTGGDNEGGFSPIANVPKTIVSALLEYLCETRGIKSLKKVLSIPPTAELAPNQTDEGDLMPYRVLDDLIYLFAEMRLSLVDCWKVICYRFPEFDREQLRKWTEDFARRLVGNQWKRDQHPVSLKVLEPDFDSKTGFRFPITQSIEEEIAQLRKASLE